MIKISDAELEVMKIIWRKKEITSSEIIDEITDQKWNRNTVRTLIKRLLNKKAIKISKKEKRLYFYVSLIDENTYKLNRIKSIIKQLFNNSLYDFFECLMTDESIHNELIDFLKNIE